MGVWDDILVRFFIRQAPTLHYTKHFVSICATGNPGSLFVLRTGFINECEYREHMGRSLGLEIY